MELLKALLKSKPSKNRQICPFLPLNPYNYLILTGNNEVDDGD
jgi:hypothetical protein